MSTILILGGARSGKSSFAEKYAKHLSTNLHLPVTFIATAQASDEEMMTRIERHRHQRPQDWTTVEEPLHVSQKIADHAQASIVLVDCLSLLLNNWMFLDGCSEPEFIERIHELAKVLASVHHPVVLVTNEVGHGIVPADPVTRQYRDWLGLLNQAVAEAAESVFWVVAGIPVDLKKLQVELP